MTQRCYIAGRISGIPRDCMEMFFAKGTSEVEALQYQPVNIIKMFPKGLPPLRERIRLLVQCNAVYILKGFGDQYDERIEFGLIQSLGIKIIYQK